MRYEIHFVPERNPLWIYVKGTLGTDHQILRKGGGGGLFANCMMFFLSLRLCSIFSGVIDQHPNTSTNQKSNGSFLRCYQVLQLFMWWKNLYIYVLLALLFFLYILPSEFQVIIWESKKQQQKDYYQSKVPFSVIPGRTPWKQRMTRKQFIANLTWK